MIRSLAMGWGLFVAAGLTGLAAAGAPQVAPSDTASTLTVGQPLPAFESLDDQGQVWKSSDHVGKRIVVLYAYPGDFTGGCIRQAQTFQDGIARLTAADIQVVGLSGDSVETHRLFHESHNLTYTLLADPEGAVAERLGIPAVKKVERVRTSGLDGKPLTNDRQRSIIVERPVTLPRWTLIIGRDGKLVSKRTNVDPAKDADEVLQIVAGLGK